MSVDPLRHIAIIMDGNNRWAKQRKLPGIAGHKAGVERIRDVMAACRDSNVEVLTLFAFSSENWRRPPKEVEALMSLFLSYLKKETRQLKKEGVRLRVIGNRQRFGKRIQRAIQEAEDTASDGDRTLVIAADYGGQWDIANAARKIAEQVASGDITAEQVDERLLDSHTSLHGLPDLDLLIRTGGELRISNFLLWQSAYTEFYFTEQYWPDFGVDSVNAAIEDYYSRQRRYGYTGDQIAKEKP